MFDARSVSERAPAARKRTLIRLWLVVQIVVPTVLLFGTRPRPFGWQMYSATRPVAKFTLERLHDSVAVDDFTAMIPRSRGEIDYARHLPALLCQQDSTVQAVLVVERGRPDRRVACP